MEPINPHRYHKSAIGLEPTDTCGYFKYYEGCSTFYKKIIEKIGTKTVEIKGNGDVITTIQTKDYVYTTSCETITSGSTSFVNIITTVETSEFKQLTLYTVVNNVASINNKVISKHFYLNKTETDAKYVSKLELQGALTAIFGTINVLLALALTLKYGADIRAYFTENKRKVQLIPRNFKIFNPQKAGKRTLKFTTSSVLGTNIYIDGIVPSGHTGDTPPDCSKRSQTEFKVILEKT
jgi:hypothetical protein